MEVYKFLGIFPLRRMSAWKGFCNGWALASTYFKRPQYPVTLFGQLGKPVVFYPEDIKTYSTVLSARAERQQFNEATQKKEPILFQMLGKRCHRKSKRENCVGVNPAAFHIAVTQLLSSGRYIILDVDPGPEVWNHPVFYISFKYSLPKKATSTEPIPALFTNIGLVDYSGDYKSPLSFSKDKKIDFRPGSYRYPNHRPAKYIVKVEAEAVVANFSQEMSIEKTDTPQILPNGKTSYPNDERVGGLIYKYDLELDKDFEIIGGEWQSKQRPDFAWAHVSNTKGPFSKIELKGLKLGQWDLKKPIPSDWANAIKTSSKRNQPLRAFVDVLHKLSQYPPEMQHKIEYAHDLNQNL